LYERLSIRSTIARNAVAGIVVVNGGHCNRGIDGLQRLCYRGIAMSSETLLRAFQRRLLAWYQVHQRDLPWRKTRDPYRILVSEVMLQQTQVDRVIPKYHEFLRRYPTVKALAKARMAQLRGVWYPLGYNVRPLRLRRIARRALRDHGGMIPNSYEGLLAMDGIGRYTAGAVLSFAFKQDAPIVDTNVARLLSRYFGLMPRSPNGPSRRRLWQLAEDVIPKGQGYVINQAMMDFGALVCTARAPKCPTCALRRTCRSFPYEQAKSQTHPGRHRAR
jgi:A/G-specific adenine glycosylase